MGSPGKSRKGSDGGKGCGGEEGVGHWLHVDVAEGTKLSNGGSSNGRFGFGLNDSATHGLEDVLRETSVTLQGRRANVEDRAGRSRNGGDGERVSRTASVTLDVVRRRVAVRSPRDAVGVTGLPVELNPFDFDSETGHHGDREVDVSLGNNNVASKLEVDLFACVRRTKEDRGDVLGGNGGGELNMATSKSCGGGFDGEGEGTDSSNVRDRSTVRGESVDKRTDRSLLHASVPRDRRVGGAIRRLNESANGSEESRGSSGVTEVKLFVILGWLLSDCEISLVPKSSKVRAWDGEDSRIIFHRHQSRPKFRRYPPK